MSSATASLRGGAPLPPDMKDLLNKLVAADEGVAHQSTCVAAKFQMCQIGGTHFGCALNTSCNFVSQRFVGNNPGATQAGKYCQQNTLEDELVEESEYLQVANEECNVLGPEDGGCVPTNVAGLSCKDGYTCEVPQDATLGTCVLDTNRAGGSSDPAPAPTPSHAVRCAPFYTAQHPCSNTEDCLDDAINATPVGDYQCEARCVGATATEQGVCASPTFEEEEEDLAAAADAGTPIDEAHCLITTEDTQPSCTLNANGSEIPTPQGKLCCGKDADGNLFRGDGISCNYYGNHVNSVRNGDSGPGAYCVYAPGEDLAVN